MAHSLNEVQNATKIVINTIAIIIFVLFLYVISDILALIFLAIIIATALRPLADWMEGKRIPRIVGVLLIYIGGLAALGFFLYIIIPPFAREISDLTRRLPDIADRIFQGISSLRDIASHYGLESSLKDSLANLATQLNQLAGNIFSSFLDLLGGVFAAVTVLVISFYLTADKHGIEDFIRIITPKNYEPSAMRLWNKTQAKIGRWFRAQLLLGAIIGVVTYIGLTIFDMPYALAFAIIAGIFELIPIVGPILSAIPAVIFGFTVSPIFGLIIILFYVVVQQLENHLLVPIIMKRAVGLNPVLVIVALLIGGKIGGLVGLFIAVPLAVAITEIFGDVKMSKNELVAERHADK